MWSVDQARLSTESTLWRYFLKITLMVSQDTLLHSLLICEVSPDLLESLEEDKKVMEHIPAKRFDGALFEQVSSRLGISVNGCDHFIS